MVATFLLLLLCLEIPTLLMKSQHKNGWVTTAWHAEKIGFSPDLHATKGTRRPHSAYFPLPSWVAVDVLFSSLYFFLRGLLVFLVTMECGFQVNQGDGMG